MTFEELPARAASYWRRLKYRNALVVDTREALDSELARAPRFIVVEGSEALRAYAASLAYRNGPEAARLEKEAPPPGAPPAYLAVPTVGRITDGYRQRRRTPSRRSTRPIRRRFGFGSGMGTVLLACVGLLAALGVEWLSFPSRNPPELIRGPHRVPRPLHGPLPTHAAMSTMHAWAVRAETFVLAMLATGALLYLVWEAFGGGRAVRINWRVDHRVQGRLVMARVRTQAA